MSDVGHRQFLLSKNRDFDLDWPSAEVGDYTLFYHHGIEYTSIESDGLSLQLVGEIFDWKFPEWTNEDILNFLVKKSSKNSFVDELSRFMGHYVLIYKSKDDFFLLNDACGQYEAYYSDGFSVIGSQVKLINRVLKCEPHTDPAEIAFFQSQQFRSKKIFVGDYTHVSNVRHLRPNHLINLHTHTHRVERFYPIEKNVRMKLEEASMLAAEMISGYVASISNRHRISVAVTAGYDSRVLLFASQNRNAQYYISRHIGMPESHVDIEIGRKLTDLLNVDFRVVKDLPRASTWLEANFDASIDFPRYLSMPSYDFGKCVYLNGNCSEVARSYFGKFPNLNGDDLARMLGYPNSALAKKACRNWLSVDENVFRALNFDPLDFFYWEEKMGNWGAKKRTETNAIGRTVYSPFNSRGLLDVLLSVDKSHRDSLDNKLYKRIIRLLHSEGMKLPINPTRKNMVIGALKKMRIYDYYRYLGTKTGLLKY